MIISTEATENRQKNYTQTVHYSTEIRRYYYSAQVHNTAHIMCFSTLKWKQMACQKGKINCRMLEQYNLTIMTCAAE